MFWTMHKNEYEIKVLISVKTKITIVMLLQEQIGYFVYKLHRIELLVFLINQFGCNFYYVNEKLSVFLLLLYWECLAFRKLFSHETQTDLFQKYI